MASFHLHPGPVTCDPDAYQPLPRDPAAYTTHADLSVQLDLETTQRLDSPPSRVQGSETVFLDSHAVGICLS